MKEETRLSCFTCPDNRITCLTCRNVNACNGCHLCNTAQCEPCIHCEIECDYDKFCIHRIMWKETMINKRKEDNKDVSIKDMKDIKDINIKEKNIPEIIIVPHEKVWGDTGLQCINECPYKTNGLTMLIYPMVASKLVYLQNKFKHNEFLAAGNAEKINDKAYLLTDITVPAQTVGSASVDNIVYDKPYNTVIHKHPGANPGGFSHSDEETLNSNHDFSIVIGSDGLGGMKGVARIKVECGRYMKTDLEVNIYLPDVMKDDTFIKSIENIKEKYNTKKNDVVYYPNREKDIKNKYTDYYEKYGYFG